MRTHCDGDANALRLECERNAIKERKEKERKEKKRKGNGRYLRIHVGCRASNARESKLQRTLLFFLMKKCKARRGLHFIA
ncbi:MAG: hypothetical protein PHI32_08095 [Dysgonamonadaceae bacterium]|nr:hypothetical protein [Dysgonamonadaceae bacterium]